MTSAVYPASPSYPAPSQSGQWLSRIWDKLSGIPFLSYATQSEKHLFISEFFKTRSFWDFYSSPTSELTKRLVRLETIPNPAAERDALYTLFKKQAERTLSNHLQNDEVRRWVQGMIEKKQLESFVKELFQNCDSIEELSPLRSLSAAQKRRCLAALRETSWQGQLQAALTAISIELPLTFLGGHFLAFLFVCTGILRDICLAAGELFGCSNDSLAATVISAPLFEEITFRAFLHAIIKQILSLLQPILQLDDETIQQITVALSATLFGLAHFYNPHEDVEMTLIHALTTFMGGLSLGMLYERYGFLASLFSHSLFNGALSFIDAMFSTERVASRFLKGGCI